MILALGFLIRLLYGASIINVEVSPWLYLTIMSFSFYLGLGKRRNEIIKIGKETRGVLKYYNEEFLDKNMYMCLSISIVFYALWTAFSDNYLLIWTVPLFILILMKYSLNIEKDSLGDPVDVVLNDKILIGLILVYGILLFSLIYLVK